MFSEFQCFFSMFFHHKNLIFLDSCTDTLYPFDHKLIRSKSSLKVFCAQIFMRRNIHGKITQSGEFCDIHCYLLVPLSTTANIVTTVTQIHLELQESHPKFLWARQRPLPPSKAFGQTPPPKPLVRDPRSATPLEPFTNT